ncbi:sulfotransferase domain-containing protein [Lyngbya sp. PCC 8106]|uniref:sulfotransferase domain-containing protein n=1 Tax=Lyngbya sp. (strain PCC 8106) TaxID=313612 RepID=UPI0000EAAAB4|nr:sulfotransferase domain-containing protein [Lyngbya sp. PCC 8106]EAW35922.1 putative deacetylase sulfotransferase [Lyngbya sp. PCC 8106]
MNQHPASNPPSPFDSLQIGVARFLSAPLRMLPHFIIIGVQKAGTSSLYNYLSQHPCIYPACTKEVHYFDLNFSRGLTWYRSHFPLQLKAHYQTLFKQQKFLTGEASPYYIFHPLVAERVAQIVPNVKLIVLLRNPVDRAYSHYQHEFKLGFETILSFEEAIAKEEERLAEEADKIGENPSYNSFNYQHYSYLSRGIYLPQIEKWQQFFKPEQILILAMDDLLTYPKILYKKTLDFLELPEWFPQKFKKYNRNQYSSLNPETRQKLVDYFRPHNQRLYEYLGVRYDWEQ